MPRTPFIIFTLKSGLMPPSMAKILLLGPKVAGIWGFLYVIPNHSKNARVSIICALFAMPLKMVFRSTFCEISHINLFSSIFIIWNPHLIPRAIHIFHLPSILRLCQPLRIRSAILIFWLPSWLYSIGKRAILIRNQAIQTSHGESSSEK